VTIGGKGQEHMLLPFFFFSALPNALSPLTLMPHRPHRRLIAYVLGLLFSLPALTLAEVSTDQPGAILVFPKVVSNQQQDTIIQISNAAGSQSYAHCYYANAAPDSGTGLPSWQVTDFLITLTGLQPVSWVAGAGLPSVPPMDWPQNLYPGFVPPATLGFIGELFCLVVDASENPISQNALTGEATIIDHTTHDARKYQAIAFRALGNNNGDNTLLLNDGEYDSCPRLLLLNAFFDGAPDPILATPLQSNLTLVPCSMDIENRVPGTAAVVFDVINEFEQRVSATLTVNCFEDTPLSSIDGAAQGTHSIFNFAQQGTLVGQIRIRPIVDAGTAQGHGILGIAEEFRDAGSAGSALNLHFIGGNLQSDVIVLPNVF